MASFGILTCESADRVLWQALYDRLPPPLKAIHFSPGYAAAQGVSSWCAVARDRGEFIMQPFVMVLDEVGVTVESMYGYGGPVGEGASLRGVLEEGLAEWRRGAGVVCERMVLHPRLAEYQARLLPDHLEAPYRKEVVVVATEPVAFRAGVAAKRRSAIEKATRDGITTSRSTSRGQALTEFSALYSTTMERVGAAPRWQRQREFFDRHLCEMPGHVCLILAKQADGTTVSAAMVLVDPPEAYYQFAGNSGVSGASDLLVVESARLAHECGCPFLDLGGGVTAKEDDPVLWYKSTFSPLRRPVHVLERVHDREAFDRASRGLEGVGYFPPWRVGKQASLSATGE